MSEPENIPDRKKQRIYKKTNMKVSYNGLMSKVQANDDEANLKIPSELRELESNSYAISP
jgi:hypothetical protein